MLMTRKFFTAIFSLCILACACYGLWPRIRLESSDKNIAIIADYREVSTLAKNSGLSVEEAINILIRNGVTGMMVSELTGDNIDHGVGQAEFDTVRDPESGTEGTVISIMPTSPYREILSEWLKMRFAISDDSKTDSVMLQMPPNMLKNSGVIPDIDGLEAAKKSGLKIYYRPAPSPGHLSDRAAVMLKQVHEKYPVSVFNPSGEYVSGYPDVSALANTAKDLNIPVAAVEFSRQVGERELNMLASPLLLTLHSVTNEEMTARRISRAALRDRLVRAAVERSVRLLLLRTAPPNTSNFTFDDFSREVKLLADALIDHGFNLSWPEPLFRSEVLSTNIFTAWALSAVLLYCMFKYFVRMGMNYNSKLVIILLLSSIIFAFVILKISFVARIAGAFTAPFIAVEASLIAMDSCRRRKIITSFVFAVTGGLALASFFSNAHYMLRLSAFSGVKLTLVLPPVLVLLHDLKNRIHPESLIEFFSRPPLWGELVMIGVLLAGVGIIIFRSGNVAFIPGFEARIRETLERILIARPRTREVFAGYPSILMLNFLVSNKLFSQYREIFRIGVTLGFSSVINSFCHFHTPMALILLREFNGLWTGLIVGLVLVVFVKFIIIPLIKLIRPVIS